MLVYLILFYLSHDFTGAAPVSFLGRGVNDTITITDPASCTCAVDQRSVLDILWSCLATIFACSWVSVHPNIPGPDDSRTMKALRRLELMFWAVVAPEMVIWWAMRQWRGAWRLAQNWQGKGWTKTHGYLIQMGGFMLYKGKEPQGILSPERLKELHEKGEIDFPTITEEEIQDRSKADALSKALVIGQTSWFMLQCLARAVQGLDLTQLELLTVALAFLNGFMYFFWWNKPLDVQTSVPVYLLDVSKEEEAEAEGSIILDSSQNKSVDELQTAPLPSDDEESLLPTGSSFSSKKSRTQNLSIFQPGQTSSAIDSVSSASWDNKGSVEERGYLGTIYAIFILGPKALVMLFFGRLDDMTESVKTTTIDEGQMRIATFYALALDIGSILFALCPIAVAFGAIHCAGWALAFPSDAEAWIWRISSIVISLTPLLGLLAALWGWYEADIRFDSLLAKFFGIIDGLFVVILVCAIPIYVIARLFLLAEAFAGLRALTPSALEVVKWTTFIPHI